MVVAGPAPRARRGAPVLVLALLLTGCGPADTASPRATSTPGTGASTAVPTATTPASPRSSPAPSSGDVSWDASGPSSGVDRADWPDTEQGVKALLASLPRSVSGAPLEVYGDSTGAFYEGLGEVFVQSEEDQEGEEGPDRLTAYQLLQAGFGLGAVCAEGTYRGTAAVPVLRTGEQEGALSPAAPGVEAGAQPAWFSCRPSGEDDDDGWGHVVGWTSGTTAWLLYARDAKAARTLVTALHDAAADR